MRGSSPFTSTTRRQTRTIKAGAVFILFLILYNLSDVWTEDIMNNEISATHFYTPKVWSLRWLLLFVSLELPSSVPRNQTFICKEKFCHKAIVFKCIRIFFFYVDPETFSETFFETLMFKLCLFLTQHTSHIWTMFWSLTGCLFTLNTCTVKVSNK